ncbi:hypothetical protein AB0L82_01745 [Nocardia sp. NPDC052001]|uniref:hypothetical protein n=1 Tax=Nocardia sp. NPDC052001 TaxID=3154853 RepID=UPI00342AD7C1
MKSTLTTAFAIAAAGVTIAAPAAHAGTTTIHTDALTGSCHVGQTYELWLSHYSPGGSRLVFTDNGVPIPVDWHDWNMSSVNWTPTATGRHTLKLSGDGTPGGELLITFGSSKIVDLGTGSGLFQAAPVSLQTTVVPASDTTTPCLQ